MVCSDLRSHRFTLKLISYIIAQIGTRKKALPRNARTESLLLFEALILKVSAGLAVKVALTCRTTFC